MGRVTPENIEELNNKEVFVFGSNEAGIHGAGAAKTALKFGAKMGIGMGMQGHTYAIPTKDFNIISLPINRVRFYVDGFTAFARYHPDYEFLVTKIGCGLAGFTVEQIAPLFKEASKLENVFLPIEFWRILNEQI